MDSIIQLLNNWGQVKRFYTYQEMVHCILPSKFKQAFKYAFFPQSWTKLLENVFPIMYTILRNKTISKTAALSKEIPFPQFNVASYKSWGIRLSFEHTTTLLPGGGGGGEGKSVTATMFRKMLPKYEIFLTVLSKIAGDSSPEFYFVLSSITYLQILHFPIGAFAKS